MHLKKLVLNREEYPTKEHYPFCLEILHKTQSLEFQTPVTFFIGENGSGKSTLLEALALRCGIYIWRGIERTRSQINRYERRLFEFIRTDWADGPVKGSYFASDIFKNFARIVDEWAAADPGLLEYFGGSSLLNQSHGQSLMSFFKSRFKIEGLYILDEPETALSPQSQLELLNIIRTMSSAGHAQFIIATHSPIVLACPDATIFSFDTAPVDEIEYEHTEYYRVYKDFLDNRDKYTG